MRFWLKLMVAVLAMPTVALAEQKIAVLDMESVIRSSEAAQELRQELEQEMAQDQATLRELSQEGNRLKDKMEKEGDFMSDSEREELMSQIEDKYERFQALGERLEASAQQREQAFLQSLRPQVEVILQALVEEKDIDLILNKRALVYAKPDVDISQQVLDRLNQQ